MPGLKIPQPLSARIDFDSRKDQFHTKVNIADLRFDKNQLAGLTFTTNSKPNQWDIDLAAAVIAADSFVIPEPRVAFEIKEGDAKFTLRVASDEADSRTRMRGRILSVGDITRILLDSSDLYLKKQRWNLDRKSLLEFGTNHLVVRNLKLENQEDTSKYVRIETPAGIAKNALTAQIHNLLITDITRLLPPLGYNLQGIIHLDADVDNVFTASGLKANLAVDSLAVENIPAGRFIANANQPSTNLVALSAALEKGANSLKLDGRYNIADTNNALAFRLKMYNFQPEEIAPILRDVLTKFDGDLSSDIAITGRVSNPKIEGFIAFNGLNVVQPAATQVPYRITDQRIVFDERRVELNKFTLADEENHTLVVDGTVGLREVDAPVLNLSIDAKEFNIINNRASDNPTFYGKAFITTHMKVTGPAAKLDVDGTIRTNPGTRVVYNLESGKPGQAGQEAYIIFTDSRNGVRKAEPKLDLKEKVDVTGFGLNMKIQLDKGTRFLVIIDPKTGDQVECEGKADLVFSMRPNGEINLQGDYNLIDGFYSMNLLGLVKRKFKVQEGSVLSWRGSPTDAAINLTAIYTTKASRFELVADQAEALTPAEVQAAKRRLPVDVKLLITNTIMKPVIKFDVVVPEETQGGAIGLVSARLAQMREDENELNKQALGLIAFNRFVTTGTTQGSSGPSTQESVNETVDQTVSDVLSRQLSSLSQEYLGGVEINVNVSQDEFASGSSGGFSDKDVGVSVSKSLFDERLRVSVGGQVSSANNSQSGSSGQPALGDLTAEYRIDKSGNLNAKFFRTYNQNAITANSVERIGLSLAHTKDFSSFPRLFWSKARRDSAIKNERQRLRNNSPAKPPVSMH